jgi:O-glycosyl hydrolase
MLMPHSVSKKSTPRITRCGESSQSGQTFRPLPWGESGRRLGEVPAANGAVSLGGLRSLATFSRALLNCSALVLCTWPAAAVSQNKPILIQPEIQYQRLDGFGITIGNGGARELMALPTSERTKLLDLLFSADGSRINIVRSEVSWTAKRLSMTDPLYLRGFLYYFAEDENETAQFNLFREAQKRGEILWNSCVWSPPPQWKSNQSFRDGGELLSKHYEDFATYLAGYIEFYKNLRYQRIEVLSLQNEPDQSKVTQSCLWKGDQLRDQLKVITRLFGERGITTKLMVPELGWDHLSIYLQPILEDPQARGLISHLSAHSLETESVGRNAAKEIHKRLNLKLWQTEYALPSDQSSSGISGGLRLAIQMLKDLSQAECHAWLYWTPFTPAEWSGRIGLLERSGSTWKATKRFWSFAQFSRFLPRNCVRISASGGSSPVVAFRNPQYNGVIIILLNSSEQIVIESLETRGWSFERMVAHRTSEKEDGSAFPLPPESGSKISLTLEPNSITTLVAQIRRTR